MYGGGNNLCVGRNGGVRRDVARWVEEAAFDGEIGRDVFFTGRWLEIRGPVGNNVEVHRAERLSLRDGARIGGDVVAVLEADEIEIAAGAKLIGVVTVPWQRPEPLKRTTTKKKTTTKKTAVKKKTTTKKSLAKKTVAKKKTAKKKKTTTRK